MWKKELCGLLCRAFLNKGIQSKIMLSLSVIFVKLKKRNTKQKTTTTQQLPRVVLEVFFFSSLIFASKVAGVSCSVIAGFACERYSYNWFRMVVLGFAISCVATIECFRILIFLM